MDLDVLLTRVKDFHIEHSYIRVGQAFMTILPLVMLRDVSHTEYDCFYNDKNLELCFEFLKKRYHNKNISTTYVDINGEEIHENDVVEVLGEECTIKWNYKYGKFEIVKDNAEVLDFLDDVLSKTIGRVKRNRKEQVIMKTVSESNLVQFEEINRERIEKISSDIFCAVLEQFKDYSDVKESYRIKQIYLHSIMDSIQEELLGKFAFEVSEYYRTNEEVGNDNNE